MRVTLVVFLGLTGHAQAYKLLELIKVYGRLSEHEFSFGRGGDDFADMPWPEPYSVGAFFLCRCSSFFCRPLRGDECRQ